MQQQPSRRAMLRLGALAIAATGSTPLTAAAESAEENTAPMLNDSFPAQAAPLVREMVTVSHFNLNRLKELVTAHPALATAAWDWGFGDWETPLGAASHMGNHAIAEFLLVHGAPSTLFSAAMFGQLDVVRSMVAAQPGIERIHGPHSISLLAHARMGGNAARAVFEYLESLGDADTAPPVPLTDAEAARLSGTYSFGADETRHIEVDADMKNVHKPHVHLGAAAELDPQRDNDAAAVSSGGDDVLSRGRPVGADSVQRGKGTGGHDGHGWRRSGIGDSSLRQAGVRLI
ncbi:MAG TPA: hypothetical protein VL990_14850 [Acidobacteriaceae bacterium]|nr:hypothetical protein [Acidobacteriaceae bacterium]